MKIKTNIFFLLLVVTTLTLNAQVEFIEVETLEQMKAVQKKASDQMLMLYVDVYATWCGPCKMMDREVYTDPSVADYMNAHYVSVRMDGESDWGRIYASEQQLEGYPSMFIFSDDGERVSKIVGFTPAEKLIGSLKSVNEGFSKVKSYRASYRNGTLEAEGFADYVTVVREMGNQEEAEALASEYMEKVMESKPKPKLSDNDIRVVAFHMDLDDIWWDGFSSDTDRLRRVLKEDYILAMEKIYNNTLVKAVEEERIAQNAFTQDVITAGMGDSQLARLAYLWIHKAFQWGDEKYKMFTNGNRMYMPPVTYHDMEERQLKEVMENGKKCPR